MFDFLRRKKKETAKPHEWTWDYFVARRRHHCNSERWRQYSFHPVSWMWTYVTCQCDEQYGRSDCPVHGPTGDEVYFELADTWKIDQQEFYLETLAQCR